MQEKFLSATTGARPSLRKFRPDLPPEVEGWVQHALALDRDQRFGNVRALWTALESALHVNLRRSGLRPSFWAAAKGAVQRLVGGSPPAPSAVSALSASASEPSFIRDALARSAYRISAVPDATIELSMSDLQQPGPPPVRPASTRPVERTMRMSDADLIVEPAPSEDQD
jgi:hypothetical protein